MWRVLQSTVLLFESSRVELNLKLATTIHSSEREIRWRGTKITGSFISAQRVLVPHEPS